MNITNTQNVFVEAAPDSRLLTTESYGLSPDDPYVPAIMNWLLTRWPENGPEDIVQAEYWPLSARYVRPENPPLLGLKEMYWLDIPPVQSNWVFIAGMGGWGEGPVDVTGHKAPAVERLEVEENGRTYTNVVVSVTMMITNTATAEHHPPKTIQGIQPDSSSSNDYETATEKWESATFKVMGALQVPGEQTNFRPLRWFVFGPDSFDANGSARIEIVDQSRSDTPGYFYGWHRYPVGTQVFYRWALDERPSGAYSTEMLKANSVYHEQPTP